MPRSGAQAWKSEGRPRSVNWVVVPHYYPFCPLLHKVGKTLRARLGHHLTGDNWEKRTYGRQA
jgi:hypothetical protein